jgi:hypothetical protein
LAKSEEKVSLLLLKLAWVLSEQLMSAQYKEIVRVNNNQKILAGLLNMPGPDNV